jgi:chitinase
MVFRISFGALAGALALGLACSTGAGLPIEPSDGAKEPQLDSGSGTGGSGTTSGSGGRGKDSGPSGTRDGGTAGTAGTTAVDAGTKPSESGATEYAPYFYAWGWGNAVYPFTGLLDLKKKSGLASVTLAFVLSSGGCAPTRDIQGHQDDVNAFRAGGGKLKASFGGANGTYLENACGTANALATAITGFVKETGIDDLDFDVEQAGAMTDAVNSRRATALAAVQASSAARVSFTLAAMPRDRWGTPGGVSAAGLNVLKAAIAAGVRISHVNLMVMDYGAYFSDGHTMAELAESALTEAVTQLRTLLPNLTRAEAMQLLGATPMIGQNDVSSEIFSLDDARSLVAFARSNGLGLLSFWAINRDQPCPYQDLGVCSMVNRATFEFHSIFRGVNNP